MHKFEAYIRDFLLSNGSVSLEGMGVLQVVNAKNTAENAPAPGLPAVEFFQNKHATTTPGLIDYTAEKENRNKGLIQSDIQSFLIETRQMINIGKPFVIDGIGMIYLAKNWQFEFTQKPSSDTWEEDFTRIRNLEETAFPLTPAKTTSSNKIGFLVILITLVILGGIGYSIFYYFYDAESRHPIQNTAVPDSTQLPEPAVPNNSSILVQPKNDSVNYRFILESNPGRSVIHKEYSQLKSRNASVQMDSIMNGSSMVYRIALLKRAIPADTAFIKDSLEIYLGKTVKVEQIK